MLAKKDFDEALKLEPKNGDLVSGRGFARALLGDTKAAIADAEESLKLGIPGDELRGRPACSYNAACIYAQAAACSAFGPPDDSEKQATVMRYQDRAVELIGQALAALPPEARTGFLKQATNDAVLEPIKNYPPFVKLRPRRPQPAQTEAQPRRPNADVTRVRRFTSQTTAPASPDHRRQLETSRG